MQKQLLQSMLDLRAQQSTPLSASVQETLTTHPRCHSPAQHTGAAPQHRTAIHMKKKDAPDPERKQLQAPPGQTWVHICTFVNQYWAALQLCSHAYIPASVHVEGHATCLKIIELECVRGLTIALTIAR